MNRNSLNAFRFVAVILLVSLAFSTTAALSAQNDVRWVTVVDNREKAFSIEVPAGWRTYGGMFRFSIVDARPTIDMTSPDGKINLRMGDATIPAYSTPNAYNRNSAAPGFRVAPYASGQVFAEKYGMARFSHMCQSVRVAQSRAMTPKYSSPGQGMIRTTGGEAVFSCTLNGQQMAGYVYSETKYFGDGGPIGQWYVVALGSCLAPADQGKEAVAMLQHASESIAFNPDWLAMQEVFTRAQTQRNLSSALATIRATEAQNARAQQMMRNMEQQSDTMNDIINGVTLTRDPQSGVEREVQTGVGGPKWIDGKNNVVDSALSPGPAFHQLQTIPRQ